MLFVNKNQFIFLLFLIINTNLAQLMLIKIPDREIILYNHHLILQLSVLMN
jgi:hypothetical protein